MIFHVKTFSGYYGIQLNSVNLTSNFFLSFILLALAEIPGTLATKLHDNFGRKTTIFFATSILGVSCLAAAFVTNGAFVTVLSMVGKAASTLCFGVNYQVHNIFLIFHEVSPQSKSKRN